MSDTIFSAHGVDIVVDNTQVQITPDLLHASLGWERLRIAQSDVRAVSELAAPTSFTMGTLRLEYVKDGAPAQIDIAMPPRTQEQQAGLRSALEAAIAGDAPAPGIPGLNFVAVQVRLANQDWGSICGLNATRVRDGHIVDSREWLCLPPADYAGFSDFNISQYALDKTALTRDFAEVFSEFSEFCDADIVVSYYAQFHMSALWRAARACKLDIPERQFGCVLALVRGNVRMDTKATDFRLVDATATAQMLLDIAGANHYQGDFAEFYQQAHLKLGALQSQRVYPVLTLAQAPSEHSTSTHEDSSRKAPRSRRAWSKIATPSKIPEPNPAADPTNPLYQQHVTISGDFSPFEKDEIFAALADHGAIIGKNVTKKTTLLACGEWEGKTSKQKRAEELQSQGQEIQIWNADELFNALNLDAASS